MKEARIEYPCVWGYRIITENEKEVEKFVFDNVHKPYKMEIKNTSAGGKYTSVHLSLEVEDQQERDEIFQKLSSHPKIKMVL